MTNFADQLFADLMREHGSTLAHTRPPAPRPRVAARRTLLAAGAGCLAVAGTAGALVASGGGDGGPAYAVTKNLNGTLTLDVYQTSGIAQANAKLHQLGDNVVIVPVEAGLSEHPVAAGARRAGGPRRHQRAGEQVKGRLHHRQRAGYPGR